MDASRFVYRPFIQKISELKELYLEAEDTPYRDNILNTTSEGSGQVITSLDRPVVDSDIAKINPDNVTIQKVSQLKDEDAKNRAIYKQAQKTVAQEIEAQSGPTSPKKSKTSNSEKHTKDTVDISSDSEEKKKPKETASKKKRQKRSYKDLFV